MKDGSVILSGVRSTKSKNLAVTMLTCFISAMFIACGDDSSSDSLSVIQSSSSRVVPSGVEGSSSNSTGVVTVVDPSSVIKGTMTDDRDGQVYKTVTIGKQTWMAENLNYAYTGVKYLYEDGRYTSDSTSWCYKNEPDFCAKYGRLYTWSAAIDSAAVFSETGKGCGDWEVCNVASIDSKIRIRGVCPQGWHLPSDAEWDELITAVGGEDSAGVKLKSTSGWLDDGDGLDSYGFGVLPAGYRGSRGNFNDAGGGHAYFWNSTEVDGNNAYHWYFRFYCEYVSRVYNLKNNGYSVRCLRD